MSGFARPFTWDSDAGVMPGSQGLIPASGFAEYVGNQPPSPMKPGSEDEECACSSAPTQCDTCKAYFKAHPEIW